MLTIVTELYRLSDSHEQHGTLNKQTFSAADNLSLIHNRNKRSGSIGSGPTLGSTTRIKSTVLIY